MCTGTVHQAVCRSDEVEMDVLVEMGAMDAEMVGPSEDRSSISTQRDESIKVLHYTILSYVPSLLCYIPVAMHLCFIQYVQPYSCHCRRAPCLWHAMPCHAFGAWQHHEGSDPNIAALDRAMFTKNIG